MSRAEKSDSRNDGVRNAKPPAEPIALADEELVEDPEALALAEAEACAIDPDARYEQVTEDWVTVFGPSKLSGLVDAPGFASRMVTVPLDSAAIPYVWDPYAPDEMPSYRYGYGVFDRPFSLLVPASRAGEARSLLKVDVGSASIIGLPASYAHSVDNQRGRTIGLWALFIAFVGVYGFFVLRHFGMVH